MQKKLIALAVAGAMIAPAAMAEVTISGGLQAEIASVSGDAAVEGLYVTDGLEGASQNTGGYSFLKFAAKEDLGNGMSALAQYNFNIKTDTGIDTRDTFVGLSFSEAATILVGRLSTPYKSSTASWDPFLATSLQARGNEGMSTLHNGYVDNAIAYAGKFGDVKVVAALVVDESSAADDVGKTSGNNAFSVSVNAPIGPVEVAVAHINLSKFGTSCSEAGQGVAGNVDCSAEGEPAGTRTLVEGGDDRSATKVGVKFAQDAFSVAAQLEMLDKGLTPTGKSGNVMYVTGSFKLDDANTISASYGSHNEDANGADASTYMAIGANHAFSKTASAFVGFQTNDQGGDNDDVSVLSLGARVNF